jgi:hypothetical protein
MDDNVTAVPSKREAAGSGSTPDLEAWPDTYSQSLEGWAHASASLMKGAAELYQDIMTFSQSRFQAGIEAWQTAAACRTPADLFENQREFAEKAATQYFGQAQKIASRALELMGDASAAVRRKERMKT